MGLQSVEEQLLTKKRLRKQCNKCEEDRVPAVSYKTPNFRSAILTIWRSLDMDLEGRSLAKETAGTGSKMVNRIMAQASLAME
jgi:hypothetical protein